MSSLTDDEFINFLNHFNKDYCKTVTQLSRNKKDDGTWGEPLIINDFRMLDLDQMKIDCPTIVDEPRSTDGIFYYLKSTENNKLIIYLVEFKRTHNDEYNNKEKLDRIIREMEEENLEVKNKNKLRNKKTKLPYNENMIKDLKEARNKYDDSLENSLKNKPFESITMVLPELYENYSKDGKNIDLFLKECDIRMIVFLDKHTQNLKKENDENDSKTFNLTDKVYSKEVSKKSKNNKSKNRAFLRSSRVQTFYNKLIHRGFITSSSFYSSNEFDLFLMNEKLMKTPQKILDSNLVFDDLSEFGVV